ncbi:hypothetical protein KQI30_15405 [Clostridium bornimense]|uniref:hypothetical protein n=1 Tax=Clostridium bornimense TaxID=1216932 RepID=UPI001C124A97|nr:hypothetical protein [Clostridium bornimense]MBU5317637.1 hypothetical protein [Clostridium bornimense]
MKKCYHKRGSALMLVLILSMATLLILMSISSYIVSINRNNERYDKSNDIYKF